MRVVKKRLMTTLATFAVASVALPQQPFDVDPNFRTQLKDQSVTYVAELSTGELLLSGNMRYDGDLFPRYRTKLSSNGSEVFDYPGGSGGGKLTAWTDKFYIGGSGVRRLDSFGITDTTFISLNSGPYFFSLQTGDYHVFPDGRLLISGLNRLEDTLRGFDGYYSMIWITNQGYVDTTRVHRQADGVIGRFKELPDGKFICYGGISEYEGTPVSLIFRIEADGTLDTTFNVPPMDLGIAYTYYPTADGKVIVGGFFHFVNAPDTINLIRLLPNGLLDTTFNSNTDYTANNGQQYYYSAVTCILPIGNNRLIITGGFAEIEGQERGGIAMLDTAGNLVDDYFTGKGCGAFTYFPSVDTSINFTYRSIGKIIPSADGSYYINGSYNGYDDGTTNDTLQRFVSRLYGLNVGINELDKFKPKPLTIAPNPTAGNALLSVETPLQNAQLTLHDASGRVVLQVAWPAGSVQCQLQAGAVAPGAYVATVASRASATVATNTPQYSGRLVVLP